jgi:hypothetical protein
MADFPHERNRAARRDLHLSDAADSIGIGNGSPTEDDPIHWIFPCRIYFFFSSDISKWHKSAIESMRFEGFSRNFRPFILCKACTKQGAFSAMLEPNEKTSVRRISCNKYDLGRKIFAKLAGMKILTHERHSPTKAGRYKDAGNELRSGFKITASTRCDN